MSKGQVIHSVVDAVNARLPAAVAPPPAVHLALPEVAASFGAAREAPAWTHQRSLLHKAGRWVLFNGAVVVVAAHYIGAPPPAVTGAGAVAFVVLGALAFRRYRRLLPDARRRDVGLAAVVALKAPANLSYLSPRLALGDGCVAQRTFRSRWRWVRLDELDGVRVVTDKSGRQVRLHDREGHTVSLFPDEFAAVAKQVREATVRARQQGLLQLDDETAALLGVAPDKDYEPWLNPV